MPASGSADLGADHHEGALRRAGEGVPLVGPFDHGGRRAGRRSPGGPARGRCRRGWPAPRRARRAGRPAWATSDGDRRSGRPEHPVARFQPGSEQTAGDPAGGRLELSRRPPSGIGRRWRRRRCPATTGRPESPPSGPTTPPARCPNGPGRHGVRRRGAGGHATGAGPASFSSGGGALVGGGARSEPRAAPHLAESPTLGTAGGATGQGRVRGIPPSSATPWVGTGPTGRPTVGSGPPGSRESRRDPPWD